MWRFPPRRAPACRNSSTCCGNACSSFRVPRVFEPDYRPQSADAEDRAFTIRQEGGVYYVEGDWLLPVINSTNFDDYESISYFQRQLEAAGVYAALEEAGIEEGADRKHLRRGIRLYFLIPIPYI